MDYPPNDHLQQKGPFLRCLAAMLWRAGWRADQFRRHLLLRLSFQKPQKRKDFFPEFVPAWVIGSLRAGGGLRTPVCMWLVRRLQRRKMKIAVVTLNPSLKKGENGKRWRRVSTGIGPKTEQSVVDFRQPFLDESILLAESLDCPVFECARRMEVWKDLSQRGLYCSEKRFDEQFDLILFDGGLQDPALGGEYLPDSVKVRKFLIAENRWPQNICDLIPAGPWRSFLRDHRDIAGVWRFEESLVGVWKGSVLVQRGVSSIVREEHEATPVTQNSTGAIQEIRGMQELRQHEDNVHLVCGIGNPQKLLVQLQKSGLRIPPQRQHFRPDHDRNFCEFLSVFLSRNETCQHKGRQKLLLTTKDWVRLGSELRAHPDIFVISRVLRRIPGS